MGIRAYDYMDGVGNRYGVHTVILEVDGTEVFRSVVDRFAYEENRYIQLMDTWAVHEIVRRTGQPSAYAACV